jgi:hypothetical protein
VRGLLRGFGGGGDKRNAALASYLLFEKSYTRELIDLGYADTMKRKDEVLAFISMPSHLGDLSEMQRQGVQGASGASPPKAN